MVLNFDERFWEMPKLAWVVLKKFQYDLHNDEPLRMNAELFWRCAIPPAQCWRYAQWRTETKRRRIVTHIGQSLCTNCGVDVEFCSYVQTVLTIGHLQLQKGVVGLQDQYLRFSPFEIFRKISKFFYIFFSSSKCSPSRVKLCKKPIICWRAMADEYLYTISSRYLQKWLRYDIKRVKNRHFSRHFGTLPRFSELYFLTDFDASKSVFGSFFAFFAKIWLKKHVSQL